MMRRELIKAVALVALCGGGAGTLAQSQFGTHSWGGLTFFLAVYTTLSRHPALGVQKAQVDISRGLKQQASGAFDTTLQSGVAELRNTTPLTFYEQTQDALAGLPGGALASRQTSYTLGASKLFRDGILVSPGFQLNRITDNLTNITGVNTSSTSILIAVPLLRGRGRSVVDAQEHAAGVEVEASLLDLNQLAAQLITNVASSYWQLVGARKLLKIALDAETRAQVYVENVQALIDADHVPRSDINEVNANRADSTANRIVAEQGVIAAQEQLALDMGLTASEMLQLPDPTDDFPLGENQQVPPNSASALRFYLNEALRRRADYLAAEKRSIEARVLLTAAKNAVLPQLNLNISTGYNGLQEGHNVNSFFASPVSGLRGANATAGLTFTRPVANNLARGQLEQADATSRQADLHSADLARGISAALVTAVQGVRNAIARASKARESVESFQAALSGQRERYRLGTGSVVEILTVEDKLNTALSNQVNAELSYVLALLQFRFATGTLIAPDKAVQNLEADILLTLPFPSVPAGPE
jgi:outer membrane protein